MQQHARSGSRRSLPEPGGRGKKVGCISSHASRLSPQALQVVQTRASLTGSAKEPDAPCCSRLASGLQTRLIGVAHWHPLTGRAWSDVPPACALRGTATAAAGITLCKPQLQLSLWLARGRHAPVPHAQALGSPEVQARYTQGRASCFASRVGTAKPRPLESRLRDQRSALPLLGFRLLGLGVLTCPGARR